MLTFLTFSMLSHILFIHCFLSEGLSAFMFSNVSCLHEGKDLSSKTFQRLQCSKVPNRRHLIKACKRINREARAI